MTSNRWFRRLKWTPLPVGVGLTYIAYQQFTHIQQRNQPPHVWPEWKVRLYSSLPLRALSRAFGRFCRTELPTFLRKPIIGLYARRFGCDMSEACRPDFDEYTSLSDFFNRDLRPECRPVSQSVLISPADSVVHRCGRIVDGVIHQIKGVDFTIEEFLGELSTADENNNTMQLARNPSTSQLYYCSMYLAPGDYHGFHSPSDWKAVFRRHFPGLLLSVNTWYVDRVPKLMCLNERVSLLGNWTHGFFSMTAVGATNVGNIAIENDPHLRTDAAGADLHSHDDYVFPSSSKSAPNLKRGAKVGEFKLGSSIVLIFEAPDEFQFCVREGDRVRWGQSLGFVKPKS